MMTFVKNNLVTLISGLLIIGLSVFAVLGMTSDSVQKEMKTLAQKYGPLKSLKGSAKNQAVVDAAAQRSEAMKQEVERAKEALASVNGRDVLLENVFPGPTSETRRFDYKEAYAKEFAKWLRMLNASPLPNELELQQAQSDIDEIIARMKEQERENAPETGAIGENPRGNRPKLPDTEPDKDDPRFNKAIRAQTAKAAEIRMYLEFNSPRQQSVFHISPILTTDAAPQIEEMWFAQVGLWIQRDVINAIKAVNDAAAKQLDSETPDTVQAMPIKRLDSINISGYVLPNGGMLPFPKLSTESTGISKGFDPQPGGNPMGGDQGPATLTGRTSNDTTDVVRVELSLVMDQRDMLKFIDEMSRQNLYVCIDCDYRDVEPSEYEKGYYYGTEPLVRAQMVFETYFIRSLYDTLMPPSVREMFGNQN